MQVSRAEQQEVVERFLAALTTGDVQGLLDVLAPDVVLVPDGGGLVPAARHPIEGAQRVIALLSLFAQNAPGAKVSTLLINGGLAARVDLAGELNTAITFGDRGGADRPHLRRTQSAQAGAAGEGGGAAPLAG